jgi:glycosyltransferase involved in cell wall biosynthesis
MKKILRIIYDWPDANTSTVGLAPAPYELSISQAKLGNRIFVLCGNLNGKNLLKGKFKYDLADGKITVFNLPRALNHFGPFLTTSVFVPFYYFYIKVIYGIDLIHNHGHLGVWLMLYKYLLGFVDKTPVVGHFHIVAAAREKVLVAQNSPLSFATKYFEYPIHKFSDLILARVGEKLMTVSQDNIEDIVSCLKVNRDKVVLIESSVDSDRFKREGEKANFGFGDDAVIIANGGRLSKRKNIDVLVESLRYLPENFKLVLWGEWEESMKITVDNLIEKYNLSARVKYLGVVSYFEVDKQMRSIKFFILPSSYEGLPKVVIEALAAGAIVLASGFKVEHQIPSLHFLNAIDSKHIAEKINSLQNSPDYYQETRKIIENLYSWDSKAKLLEDIYAKISK